MLNVGFFDRYLAELIPHTLQAEGRRLLAMLLDALNDSQQQRLRHLLQQTPALAGQLIRACIGSRYLLDACCREPDLLLDWLLTEVATRPLTAATLARWVATVDATTASLQVFDEHLRRVRRQLMVALYWRDLNNLADFAEVSSAMTAMAEQFIQCALDYHYAQLVKRYGLPVGKDSGQVQPMLVVGMGKLGGGELNVSSDIDLLFVFPEGGQTHHKTQSIDNQYFFTQLGQKLIKSLNEVTAAGFVFRVDMRLRPYGQSGALVSSFAALENYYHTQGRDWERFAAIKARLVACAHIDTQWPQWASFCPERERVLPAQLAAQASADFYAVLQPFVYRRYIDFTMIASLRRLKALIVQEVQRKGLHNDIKLGAGGIREIEFIAQCFQLVRGGRDRRLQQRPLLKVLDTLGELKTLAPELVGSLRQAYIDLRTVEHRLQAYQDAQTQTLPDDVLGGERLAWLMGFDNRERFFAHLDSVRQGVDRAFQNVIAVADEEQPENPQVQAWQFVWLELFDDHLAFFQAQGFARPAAAVQQLQHFQRGRQVVSLSASARHKLDLLVPQLLNTLAEVSSPDLALQRVFEWLSSIVTRTHYLSLMIENPQVLRRLVDLLVASAQVAHTLTEAPFLLDELLDPDQLLSLPLKSELRDELRQRFLRIDGDDEEAAVETLRHFRLSHNFRAAAAEVTGSLSLMKVSDYLSVTADLVLEHLLQFTWDSLVRRHGLPAGHDDATLPPFLIVGYGKLGGLEMSYSSDLDLVFIYEADPQAMTRGQKPLDHQTFYTRLGQKMIHYLNARTLSGPLYEVDMRLRPSGNSGLLVTSLQAFRRYQLHDAWTWEHQALVRARPIAGSVHLREHFLALRRQILCQSRPIDDLQQAVVAMRAKMQTHRGSTGKSAKKQPQAAQFHLKQDAGGVVDIEFMVQYAVLAWSHQHPALCEWTDNIRIMEVLKQVGLLTSAQADQLMSIYQCYRKASHAQALQQQSAGVVDARQFAEQRQWVQALWQQLLGV